MYNDEPNQEPNQEPIVENNLKYINAFANEEIKSEEDLDSKVQMNSFSKIVGIVVSPIKALQAIKRKPTLLIVMAIICILPVISMFFTWSDYETMLIQQMEQQFETMKVTVTQEMMDFQMTITKVMMPISLIIGMLFSGLISGVYYFVCAKIAKSEVTFKKMLSLAYHVLVITACMQLLNVVLTLVGIDVIMGMPITSLASLLPSSMKGTFLYGMAVPIEVFSIWSLVVMYYGLKIVADMSKNAALISISISFVFSLVMSGGSILVTNLLANM